MDDGADCERDFPSAQSAAEIFRSYLAKAGIVANSSKSIWRPTQVMECLSLIWNLRKGFLALPQSRLDKLLDSLRSLRSQLPCVVPRFLASCVGRIVSLTPGVGNVSLLMSRFLQFVISFWDSWDAPIDLSAYH